LTCSRKIVKSTREGQFAQPLAFSVCCTGVSGAAHLLRLVSDMNSQTFRSWTLRRAAIWIAGSLVLGACADSAEPLMADADVSDTGPVQDIPSQAGDVATPDANLDADVPLELAPLPAEWDWSQIVSVAIELDATRMVAGDTIRARCYGLDTDGVARDLSAIEVNLDLAGMEGGSAGVAANEWRITRAGQSELRCDAALPDGRRLSAVAAVSIAPGETAMLVPVAPGTVQAGEEFDASCWAADEFGNRIGLVEATLLFDVEGAAATSTAGLWNIEQAGTYQLTCQTEGAIVALATELRVVMDEPVRMDAGLLPLPSGGLYTPGQFVRPAPQFVDAFGNSGTLAEVGGTLTSEFDVEVTALPTGFRFDNEGIYSVTQTWRSDSGTELEAQLPDIRVNSYGPATSCIHPQPQSMVPPQEGGSVRLVVQVLDFFGIEGVSAGAFGLTDLGDGEFAANWPVEQGFNIPMVVSTDSDGLVRYWYCAFQVADEAASADELLESLAVSLDGATPDRGLPLLASTLPDMASTRLGRPIVESLCESAAQDSCESLSFGTDTSIAVVAADSGVRVQDGTLWWVWTADSVTLQDGDRSLVAQSPSFRCPVLPQVLDGIVRAETSFDTCECGSSLLRAQVDGRELQADTWTDGTCQAFIGSMPDFAPAVADLLNRIDPLGSAAEMRRNVESTRISGAMDFRWNWRRLEIVVADSTLQIRYATRLSGPREIGTLPPELPTFALPADMTAAGNALWLGQTFLAQTQHALWESRFLEGWLWQGVERVDSRTSPEFALVLPLVQVALPHPAAWSFAETETRFALHDVVALNAEDFLGVDYDFVAAIVYSTELVVMDQAFAPGRIFRTPMMANSVAYSIQPLDAQFVDRSFAFLDPLLRMDLFQLHLPDLPAPVLRADDGSVLAELSFQDQPVVWDAGAAPLRGEWVIIR
jgi:hypothetical protein